MTALVTILTGCLPLPSIAGRVMNLLLDTEDKCIPMLMLPEGGVYGGPYKFTVDLQRYSLNFRLNFRDDFRLLYYIRSGSKTWGFRLPPGVLSETKGTGAYILCLVV